MPEHYALLLQVMHKGIIDVSVAIGTGKNYYSKFHVGKDSLK